MEKVTINYFRFYLAFIIIGLIDFFVLHKIETYSLKEFIETMAVLALILILYAIKNHFSKKGLSFTDKGPYLTNSKGSFFLNWSNVRIQLTLDFKYIKLIKIVFNENVSTSILLTLLSEQSITLLTKKYCPKDHAFYKIVEEYSKNRNIPF